MKNSWIYVIAGLLLTMSAAAGVGEGITISNTVIRKVDANVQVAFDVTFQKWNPNYKVTLTPVVRNENKAEELETFTVVGKFRNIADQRAGITDGNAYPRGKRRQTYHYEVTVPYQDWMQHVSLDVKKLIEGCCESELLSPVALVEDALLYYQITPHYRTDPYEYEFTELEQYTLDNPFLHSMEDYPKRYDILVKDRDKGSSVVIFTVGSHNLDMNFQGNQDVLNAISRAFQLIENDPNAILKHIMITGYASPEGSLAFNTALAKRRAETVKTYIQSLMTSPREELFEVHNGREDWDGLREKVENSSMSEKQEILEIIDSYTMEQEIRKTKLKQLNGGAPYKYMLENFYPPLRSAGYVQVYYEIDRKATVATAVTDEFGRTTWVDPESPENINITRINKATGLLMNGDYEEALILLKQTGEDPKALNTIGVCYMMKGDFDEAEVYFRKALQQGDADAQKNMDEIIMARKVFK